MDLASQIYVRKSCRDYIDGDIDMEDIHDFISNVRLLNDKIGFRHEILKKDEMNFKTRWSSPYYMAIFSEKRENYLENIGFAFQQVSLYLQSIGIGSCWVGLASVKEKNPEFVISIAFGRSNNMTRSIEDFKRKKLSEISDVEDEKLIPAQLAPSAINSQPWYFTHSSDGYDVYQAKQNILKRQVLKKWNPIDVGISLAHMYVSNPETFEFNIKTNFDDVKGHKYIGSFKI